MSLLKPKLHNILNARLPVLLVLCLLVFIVTLAFAPMSWLFLIVAIVVGLVGSLIEMEELTGGRGLSWLSSPLVLIGEILALVFSFEAATRSQEWILLLQFVSLMFFTEALVIVLLRTRLEAFSAKRDRRDGRDIQCNVDTGRE